jgi:dihydrofolate synthase/folylpolyglutamate synthase
VARRHAGEDRLREGGIFVEGKPAFSAPQAEAARRVLREQANETRCPLEFVEEPLIGYPINLPGAHQADNAALALTALHAAGVPLAYDVVHHGLSNISWPGRFEIIRGGDVPVVLDGAHNPAAAEALAATWRRQFGEKRCTLLFSTVEGKDLGGILGHLAPLAERAHLCPITSPRD